MIHIVSDAVASATERTNHQHLCCTCRNDRPAPVNHLYTCTHFRTERRESFRVITHRSIIRHTVYIFEHTERRHSRFFPKRIGVGGCHRNCFIVNNSCVSPAGGCIERSDNTFFLCHSFKGTHVFLPKFGGSDFLIHYTYANHSIVNVITCHSKIQRFTGIIHSPRRCRMLHLIFQLATDDRTAILIIQSLQLPAYLSIKSFYIREV